jgi:hypothetical protein
MALSEEYHLLRSGDARRLQPSPQTSSRSGIPERRVPWTARPM